MLILGVICLFNHIAPVVKTDEYKIKTVQNEPTNFILSDCPISNKLFQNLLVAYFNDEKLALSLITASQEERKVLSMIDSILRFPNMRKFMETVEEEFSRFFEAERANFVIVNRYNKEMYRVIYDQESKEFKMKLYGFDQGVSGYTAISG